MSKGVDGSDMYLVNVRGEPPYYTMELYPGWNLVGICLLSRALYLSGENSYPHFLYGDSAF